MPASAGASERLADFVVLIPARLRSTRLPDKPLADIGGRPMVVRVAERAIGSGARRVVIATDSEAVANAVRDAGFEAIMTRPDHPSGSDRLAEAAALLRLADDELVVNVQGDEPMMPPHIIADLAQVLAASADAAMATVAHPIATLAEFTNPNVVKVVVDAQGRASYFSRAPIPYPRDAGLPAGPAAEGLPPEVQRRILSAASPLRHVGIYAYRAAFLRRYPAMGRAPAEDAESLEQLRALWHGWPIAVMQIAEAPPGGVDTAADLERVRSAFAAGDVESAL